MGKAQAAVALASPCPTAHGSPPWGSRWSLDPGKSLQAPERRCSCRHRDGHGLGCSGPEGPDQGLCRRSTSLWDSCRLHPASAGTLRPASTGEPALVVLPAWAAPTRTNPCPYRHRLFRFATRDRPRPWPKSFAPTGLWPPTAPWRALSKRVNRPCPEGALVKRAAQVVWFWTAQEREGSPPGAAVSGTPEKPKGVDVVGPTS